MLCGHSMGLPVSCVYGLQVAEMKKLARRDCPRLLIKIVVILARLWPDCLDVGA